MNVTKSINIAPLITTVKINVLNLPRIKNELRKGETGKGNHHKSIIFFRISELKKYFLKSAFLTMMFDIIYFCGSDENNRTNAFKHFVQTIKD